MLAIPRWLRFRLSTVLILTAIAAWGMALRPYIAIGRSDIELAFGADKLEATSFWAFSTTAVSYVEQGDETFMSFNIMVGPNPGLKWPLLTLFAFLAWKAGWATVARRRSKVSQSEPTSRI